MFSLTSGPVFAFLSVFFVASGSASDFDFSTGRQDPFPIVMNRIQHNLRGMNESLVSYEHDPDPVQIIQDDLKVAFQLANAEIDISILPPNASDFLLTSAESIKNVSTMVDAVNHQFVSAIHFREMAAMGQMTYNQWDYPYQIRALNTHLGMFKSMIDKVFKPYYQRLVDWMQDAILDHDLRMPGFSPEEMMMQAGSILLSLYKLMPVIIDIQENDAAKLGTVTVNRINDVINSVCSISAVINECSGVNCDQFMRDINKFLTKCHK